MLDLIAASLEAGGGISQALELVVAEADEPSATEFARVLAATRLGATLVDALRDMAERLDSRDLRYTVQAVAIQQRTGGRLAEVLRIVAEFMRGRAEVRREIRALTAEGRLSAYVLGGLPFAARRLHQPGQPRLPDPAVHQLAGLVLLGGTAVLMGIAFFAHVPHHQDRGLTCSCSPSCRRASVSVPSRTALPRPAAGGRRADAIEVALGDGRAPEAEAARRHRASIYRAVEPVLDVGGRLVAGCRRRGRLELLRRRIV